MNLSSTLAKRFRAIYTGNNWTNTNIKEAVANVTWEQAVTKVHSFNTIAALIFHMNYYVSVALKVLQGGPLEGHDKLSFDCPPIRSEEDWEKLKYKAFADAEAVAALVEQFPESKFGETFTNEKYGTYYSNIVGLIEHNHYHLGQVVLIKKILAEKN